jgi:hypothetical protein
MSRLPQTPAFPHIVQIVANVEGGVLDYVRRFDREFKRRGALTETLLIPTSRGPGYRLADEIGIRLQGRGLMPAVILHFSGYGLAKRGLCFWLLDEMAAVRGLLGGRLRVCVIFHELFAFGPPWKSAFWLSPVQRLIAARLVRLATISWTTTAKHAHWLRVHARAALPVLARPVFSTIGEPLAVKPLRERTRRMVVFGSHPTRQRAYRLIERLQPTLASIDPTEVVEVGSGASCGLDWGGLPARFLGKLSDENLSELLLDSTFALIDYPADYLAKSSVFAAYAVHGCVTVNTSAQHANQDGLAQGQHYLSEPVAHLERDAFLASVAAQAQQWYGPHRFALQVEELLGFASGTFSEDALSSRASVVPG